MKNIVLVAIFFVCTANAQDRLPIIDMHLHATSVTDFGGPMSVCTNEGEILYPDLDPRIPMTVDRAAVCDSPQMSSQTDAELLSETAEMLRRYNIFAVADGTLEDLDRWRAASPGRIISAMNFNPFNDDGIDLSPAEFRKLFIEGKLQVFAEVGPQYQGKLATDDVLDKYFALAEELDISIGFHLGEGPPGGAHVFGYFLQQCGSFLAIIGRTDRFTSLGIILNWRKSLGRLGAEVSVVVL
jgi:predicted TIM-barrel fold metal-dependent hydrolase